MMRTYALLDASGTFPVQVFSTNMPSRPIPDGMVSVPNNVDGLMLIDGQWVPRPQVADPIVTGNIVRFEGVPDGAVCEIIDCDFNSVAGQVSVENGVIEFQLADAGTYQLFLTIPLPWINKANTVVIT